MSSTNFAYVIGHINICDDAKWAEYRSRVPATLAPWGAKLILRGKTAAVLAGSYAHTDVVVIRFPDLDAVNGWYASEAYQALIPLRTAAAQIDLISYCD